MQIDERSIVGSIATDGDRGFTVQGEYLPNAIDPYNVGPDLVPAPQVRGSGRVLRWQRKHADVYATVTAGATSTVVFPILYYDFYRVTGASRTVNVRGLLGAVVTPGLHELHVSHGPTAVNYAGFGITLLSAALLVLLVRRRGFSSGARTATVETMNRRAEDPSPVRT